jgi:hypothetical protein
MQEMTTPVTSVPNGDDEGGWRLRQLTDCDTESSRHGQSGWVLHSTHTIAGGERVTFVDTLIRPTSND